MKPAPPVTSIVGLMAVNRGGGSGMRPPGSGPEATGRSDARHTDQASHGDGAGPSSAHDARRTRLSITDREARGKIREHLFKRDCSTTNVVNPPPEVKTPTHRIIIMDAT